MRRERQRQLAVGNVRAQRPRAEERVAGEAEDVAAARRDDVDDLPKVLVDVVLQPVDGGGLGGDIAESVVAVAGTRLESGEAKGGTRINSALDGPLMGLICGELLGDAMALGGMARAWAASGRPSGLRELGVLAAAA